MKTSLVQQLIPENIISGKTFKKPIVIFVVEDSEIYRMFLVRSLLRLTNSDLTHKPYCMVHSFASGEACLENMWKKPDIVVLDYFLNGNNPEAMDGLQLLKQIKQLSTSTEILMHSDQNDVLIAAELFNQGASSYVPKEPQGQNRIQNVVLDTIQKLEKEGRKKRNHAVLAIIIFLVGIAAVLI